MILRGLLVVAGGFLFIFAPGLPIGLLAKRLPALDRGLMYWGMGAWLIGLIPSLFLQSLMRQVIQAGQPGASPTGSGLDYATTLAASLLTAFFVFGGAYLVLRRRRCESAELLPGGVSLGLGVGIIGQVFTGLSLVGAGFSLIFGGAEAPGAGLAGLAEARLPQLGLELLSLVLFRVALPAVSAAAGLLVARSLAGERGRFWSAVALSAAFGWGIVALQLALRVERPGLVLAGSAGPLVSMTGIVYYSVAFALAYGWLVRQIEARDASRGGAVELPKRKRGAKE